jgi:hypothetical protein
MSSIISSAEAPREHRVQNNSLMLAMRKSLQNANETGRNLIFRGDDASSFSRPLIRDPLHASRRRAGCA